MSTWGDFKLTSSAVMHRDDSYANNSNVKHIIRATGLNVADLQAPAPAQRTASGPMGGLPGTGTGDDRLTIRSNRSHRGGDGDEANRDDNSILSAAARASADRRSDNSIQRSIDGMRRRGKGGLGGIGVNQHRLAQDVEDLESGHSAWFGTDSDDDDDDNFNREHLYDLFEGRVGWRKRLRDIFEGNPHHRDFITAIVINVVMLLAILVSCIVFCISSLPQFINETFDSPLFAIESACILIFIIEALLRVAVASNFRQLLSFFFAIDVLSIVGYFVDLLLSVGGAGVEGLSVFRVIRLVRVFRVLKVSRHSKALQLVYVVFRNSVSGLTVLLIPILLCITVFACAIYLFELEGSTWNEQRRRWEDNDGFPVPFQSIPDALWFCTSTITTVGYGDIVTRTVGGKLCAATVQLAGVLLLSFPNIVLGGNLQFAFKTYNRHRAIKRLGKKFRKVFFLLGFVNALKARVAAKRAIVGPPTGTGDSADAAQGGWMVAASLVSDTHQSASTSIAAAEVPQISLEATHAESTVLGGAAEQSSSSFSPAANDEPPMASSPAAAEKRSTTPRKVAGGWGGGGVGFDARRIASKAKKAPTNFLMTKAEAEHFHREGVDPINETNIRSWEYNGVTAVTILQRLLEFCSGVGTTEELADSYLEVGGDVKVKDVAIACIYLMEAGYLQLFVFKKFGVVMLAALTPDAVMELLLHPEEGDVECIRSSDVARVVWRRTVGSTVNFTLQQLATTYQSWACGEKLVDNELSTPHPDFKVYFDPHGTVQPASMRASSSFRRSSVYHGPGGLGVPGGAAKRPSTAAARNARENPVMLREAKEALRAIVARQSERIHALQQTLREAEQNVTNMYGL